MSTVHTQMSLKEKQRQEREALILQAAEDAFAEKGFHNTSMDEVAARVGIAKGTVYLHFSCKEDLVVAIFTRDIQRLLEEIETAVAVESKARAKLEALLRCMYTGMQKKRALLLSSLYNGVDMRRMLAENTSRIQELWSRMVVFVTTLLEEGKAAGEFDTSLPTQVMLLAFFGLFSPKTPGRLMPEDMPSPEEFVTYMGRIFFDGVGAKTGDF